MITMKGAAVSAKLKEQVEKGLETLTWVPKLTIIRVGENPDDISYEKGATKKLTSFGLEVESKVFPGDISDEAFKKEFAAINADASVDGILMLRPLPKQINEQDIEKMIDPAKDLDGISPVNIAKVFSGPKLAARHSAAQPQRSEYKTPASASTRGTRPRSRTARRPARRPRLNGSVRPQ